MNKKAIAILGAIFVLIIGTLGFLIYSKYAGPKQPVDNIADETGGNNVEPTPTPTPVSTNKFNKLTNEQVVSPALTFDGTGVAYFTKQGLLFRSTFLEGSNPLVFGETKQLAIEPKPGLSKVIWPLNSKSFMLEYTNTGKKTWEYYNNNSGQFTVIPTQVFSLSFLPNPDPDNAPDKMFYVWSSASGNDTVNISNGETSDYKTLGEIWDKNSVVYVSPDSMNVVYHIEPSLVSGIENPIVLTDVDGKTWRKIVASGFNSGVVWSPDGKKFIFGKRDPSSQKYQLWYYDLLGGEVKNLGMFTTTEKIVWAGNSQTIYLAVPKTGSAETGLTEDVFYKLEIATGQSTQYDPGSQQLDGRDLFLSKEGTKLFFRNAQDGGLYYLDLNLGN